MKIYSHGIFNMKGQMMYFVRSAWPNHNGGITKLHLYSTDVIFLGCGTCSFVYRALLREGGGGGCNSPKSILRQTWLHSARTDPKCCLGEQFKLFEMCTYLLQTAIGRELIWFLCLTAQAMPTWETLSMRWCSHANMGHCFHFCCYYYYWCIKLL